MTVYYGDVVRYFRAHYPILETAMEASEVEEEERAFEVQQMRKRKNPAGLKSGKAVSFRAIEEMTLLQMLHTVNAFSLNLR